MVMLPPPPFVWNGELGEIAIRFQSVVDLRDHIEAQLQHLSDQRKIRTDAEIARIAQLLTYQPLDPRRLTESDRIIAEAHIAALAHELEEFIDDIAPRYFRGGYLASLWNAFEQAFDQITDYAAQQRQHSLSRKDLKGNCITIWRKYWGNVLPDRLPLADAEWEFLDDVRELRNAYSHTGGTIDRLSQNLQARIRSIAERNSNVSVRQMSAYRPRASVHVTATFVEDVASELTRLFEKSFRLTESRDELVAALRNGTRNRNENSE